MNKICLKTYNHLKISNFLLKNNVNNIYIIVFVFGYKALFLLFGLFLAFGTRRLKMKYINDLRFVTLAICNVSVLCIICVPIAVFFLQTQIDAFFGFISVTG